MTARYAFRRVTPDDLAMIAGWLAEPHVVRWWGDPAEQLALVSGDVTEPAMRLKIVSFEEGPFAYIQSYDPHAFDVLTDQPKGVLGVDQFIGVPDMVGKGHGPRFIRAYADTLFEGGATRVVTDPDPENAVAIRAYEKAGFRREKLIETPDGPAVLMARDRA